MTVLLTKSLDAEVLRAAQEAKTPFPASDCEKVARQAGIDPQRFVSDLDTYFYDIWSPSSGVQKLSRKPDAWLRNLQTYLAQDFFARYAHHAPLQALVTQQTAPDLYQRLQMFDTLRKDLILFLSQLPARHETTQNGNGAASKIARE